MTYGNPSAGNVSPLLDHDPQRHGFRPWSLDAKRCRVMVRVGSGYTHCYRTLAAHEPASDDDGSSPNHYEGE